MSDERPDERPAGPRETRFALRYGDADVPLRVGTMRIGRGKECDFFLDGVTVSRVHARLEVTPDALVLHDESSANGAFVNGNRILGSQEVVPGDEIRLGDVALLVVWAKRMRRASEPPKSDDLLSTDSINTLVDLVGMHQAALSRTPRPPPDEPRARTISSPSIRARSSTPPPRRSPSGSMPAPRPDPFESQTSFPEAADAEIALTLGDVIEAERILVPALARVRGHVDDGSRVSPELAEQAARLAAELAIATSKTGWIDYAFRLYTRLREPIPPAVFQKLKEAIRLDLRFSPDEIDKYRAALRTPLVPLTTGQLADLQVLGALAEAVRERRS